MAAPETQEKVAAVGFGAVLAAMAGPVGILIAALAVGFERAWGGDAGRPMTQEHAKQAVLDHRQWLAEDTARRASRRAARKAWLDSDADPATEPARPSTAHRFGEWLQRQRHRTAVSWDDFRRGFRDGRHAARDEWARGGSFRDVARARPDHPDADRMDWSTVQEPELPPEWRRPPPPGPVPQQPRQVPDRPAADDPPTPAPEPIPPNPQPVDPTEPVKESPVTTTTANRGPSNVDVVAKSLETMSRTVDKINAGIDDLDRLADALAQQARQTADFAANTGQATATKAATDAANAAVAKLKALVLAASQAAVQAAEEVDSARQSVKPVQKAEDDLNAVGATGEAVAPAKAA